MLPSRPSTHWHMVHTQPPPPNLPSACNCNAHHASTAFSSQPLLVCGTPLRPHPAGKVLVSGPSSLELSATTDAVHRLACLEPYASGVLIYDNGGLLPGGAAASSEAAAVQSIGGG